MKHSLLYIFLGLITGSVIAWFSAQHFNQNSQNKTEPMFVSFADAVDRAAPSVVNIYTTKITQRQHQNNNNPFYNLFVEQQNKRMQQQRELSLGSGVILHEDGLILTNYHVINNAERILVLLYDGRKYLAEVIGSDKETDLAVLKINAEALKAIHTSSSESVRVGDPVLAIGNPFGFGQSVSAGIISGKGRYGLNLNTYEDFIQTDAAINVGSSGGALVDHNGHLIGINTAMYSQSGGSQGIGLAIPIEIASKVLTDIIQHGHVVRGWLGLEGAQLSPSAAKSLNLADDTGIVITKVFEGGPAAHAGIQMHDIITHINNQAMESSHKGLLEVANLAPGEKIPLQLIRGQQSLNLDIIVGMRPASN
jgi:serine protease DegS